MPPQAHEAPRSPREEARIMLVINPKDPQPIVLHFTESWIDPGTGQRLKRVALGACSSGQLILNPIGHNGPVELLWRGPHLNRRTLSPALLETVKAGWCTMCHKPPDTWHAIKLRDELFWLSRLP